MEQIRKLPIGIQTFEDIRKDGYLYVDKTAMVYQLASASVPYFLSRPRRFGKSLLMSTIEAYFKGAKNSLKVLKSPHTRKNGKNIRCFISICQARTITTSLP